MARVIKNGNHNAKTNLGKSKKVYDRKKTKVRYV